MLGIDTNGKPVTRCPKCGGPAEAHKYETVTLAPDFKNFTTSGGTFLSPKCPPRLKLVS